MNTDAIIAQPAPPLQDPPAVAWNSGARTPVGEAVRLSVRAEHYLQIWRGTFGADEPAAWRAFCAAHDLSEAAWQFACGRR